MARSGWLHFFLRWHWAHIGNFVVCFLVLCFSVLWDQVRSSGRRCRRTYRAPYGAAPLSCQCARPGAGTVLNMMRMTTYSRATHEQRQEQSSPRSVHRCPSRGSAWRGVRLQCMRRCAWCAPWPSSQWSCPTLARRSATRSASRPCRSACGSILWREPKRCVAQVAATTSSSGALRDPARQKRLSCVFLTGTTRGLRSVGFNRPGQRGGTI